jgi:cell wall-associated NlpC family hydrolase
MITRTEFVSIAHSWLGTPYGPLGAMRKGCGCDCATFLLGSLIEAGLVTEDKLGIYSGDWWAHTTDERYMLRVLRHAAKIAEGIAYATSEAKPGDLVLTRTVGSHVYNHGGIVVEWPVIIHAIHPAVQQADASRHPLWAYHEVGIFDPWAKAAQ